jgi:hypothetical protein
MSALTRFKSDEKLQTEAMDILTEMIRRELLSVSVATDLPISVRCPVRDAIFCREGTATEVLREKLGGEPVKRVPGIDLILDRSFRLPATEEAQVRAALRDTRS